MIDVAVSAEATTLAVVGDLDLASRDHFDDVAARVSTLEQPMVVVDLCRATFIDSSGAAFLMSLADTANRQDKQALLRGASSSVLFVLEICGALPRFQIDHDHQCDEQD